MAHLLDRIVLDGVAIYSQSWTTNNAKANIFIIHGYAEHSGRYKEVATFFNSAGYNVYTYDRRGSGRSEGERSYIISFDLILKDMRAVIENTKMPPYPSFLLGHSLGGLIGAEYLVEEDFPPFKGAVFTAAAIKIDDSISPLLRKMSGFIGTYFPHLKTIKLVTDHLSRDKTVVQKYIKDPLVYHGGTKARSGLKILESMRDIPTKLQNIKLPILFLHGGSDRIADPEGSQIFYDNVSSLDREIKIYDELYHEIMNEPEKEEVLKDIISWLDARC